MKDAFCLYRNNLSHTRYVITESLASHITERRHANVGQTLQLAATHENIVNISGGARLFVNKKQMSLVG